MQTVLPPPAEFIPVALPLTEHSAPNAYATILSGINNLLPGVRLALYMLHEGLPEETMTAGRRLFDGRRSQIHFVDVSEWMQTYNPAYLDTTDRTTFYSLAVPTLFANFSRIVYLSDDILLRACPSLLYYSIPATAQIGATRDLLLIPAQTNGFRLPQAIAGGPPLVDYHCGALGVLDSNNYFQNGVLVFNMAEISQAQAEECGHLCSTLFWMSDQDILNRIFYGKVHFIHQNWNVCWGPGCVEASETLPAEWKKIYDAGLANPFAVHFSGFPKPWTGWDGPYAEDFRRLLGDVLRAFP